MKLAFKMWVENIQAMTYKGKHTVIQIGERW